MSRKPINWAVEKDDIKEFILPINIEIPIDKGQYQYIFQKNVVSKRKAKDVFRDLEETIVNRLYKNNNYDIYKKILNSELSLSYIPNFKDNNWYIGYSPVQIYNNIFKTLNIDFKLDYIDYNDNISVTKLKYLIEVRLIEENLKLSKEHKDNSAKEAFIDDSIRNIDNIFSLAGYNIENTFYSSAVLKNLLYYLSVKSLDILDETDNVDYGILPRQYYLEVTNPNRKKKPNYPNQLFMNNEAYSYSFNNYNNRFNKTLFRYPCLFETTLGLDEINIVDRFKVLKSDDFMEDVEVSYKKYKERKDYTKTDEELDNMLIQKMNFYRELLSLKNEKDEKVVVGTVKGMHQLDDYYGFVLNNNYIVLDKFFTIRKKDKKLRPSSDEALFSMPLDLYVELGGSKRKIKKYIKENKEGNVKRLYHTKKQTYTQKILKISKNENASTMNYDWFLSIYAPKKLTLTNK